MLNCIYLYICTYIYICIHIYIHTYKRRSAIWRVSRPGGRRRRVPAAYIYIYIYMFTTHIYIYIYIYTAIIFYHYYYYIHILAYVVIDAYPPLSNSVTRRVPISRPPQQIITILLLLLPLMITIIIIMIMITLGRDFRTSSPRLEPLGLFDGRALK